jgi:hypothetical protein
MVRRGFKTEAEAISLEKRGELKLEPVDPLDPFELAERLAIPVVSFDDCGDFAGLDRHARAVLSALSDRVCALTACVGHARVIIYDDRNARTRQVSDIAHELSHTLLEHEPTPIDHPECYFERDVEIEEEANILAGALLVPREGALALARGGMSDEDLAAHYGVSIAMARWRSGMTGIRLQVQRGRGGRR